MEREFTRQETIRLAGVTSNKLSYLDRTGLVVPRRMGNPKRSEVRYTLAQILQIKTIYRLREELSLQAIRVVLEELERSGYEPSLFKMKLLFFNGQLYLIESQDQFEQTIVQLTGKHKGQIVLQAVDPIGDVIQEMHEAALRYQIIDFAQRVEGTPCAR